MTSDALVVPLAPDCEALRADLIERQLPPVWSLDAATARRLYREGVDALREAWQPPIESLPVTMHDIEPSDRLPAMRLYRNTESRADVETPAAVTIIWFHGGGWVLGDIAAAEPAAATACALTGWDVINVDYRCAPVDPFPAAADDAIAATRWVLEQGRRVVVAGDSAGGNLAGVVARQLVGEPGLIGQVLIYPAADTALSYPSAAEFTEGPFLTRRDMEWYLGQYLPAGTDRTDSRVDLMTPDVQHGIAPAIVFTVGHDPLRDEGIAYGARLADRGVAVTHIHAPELFHGCFTSSGVLPSSAARVREVWAAAQRMFA